MKKKITTLLLLAIFTNFGYAQSNKINIKTKHLTEANYLKADDFYLTHYLYVDLFLREKLFPEATTEEVASILKALKKYVSPENKLDVEIEKPGKRNYLIRFTILKKNDGTVLLIAFTNWTVKKKEFEKEIKIENDSYTRWYFLNGNKMTYRNDMSNQNNYSTMDNPNLASAYLFDELSDNDSKTESSIKEYLNQGYLNVYDKLLANLILLKYHIFKGENDKITKQTEHLTMLFEQNKNAINLEVFQMIFDATKFQIELLK
ncbi:hypothetical protein [uncultured Tenacibaculum sp.]|uniref:hypothetical protein n=1 Tax=uncultured Tenacibaculum sp. TaxID=174713 RepID=UPI0026333524|nr:hypothetical protein [uncultured Tenacibaculum sp.]